MKPAVLMLILAACAAGAAPTQAEPSRADLAHVGVQAPAGAREPLGLAFTDASGRPTTLRQAIGDRPALLVFEDFRCKTLCGPALSIVAAGIGRSGLRPGRDFHLVSIGLNPRETPADATAFRDARLAGDPALVDGSRFLVGSAETIAQATRALGYGYAYDPVADQFTHPVAAFVLAADGRLTRVLPQTALTASDLREAFAGAGRGEVGDIVDRLGLLCHGLFPLDGRNDGAVQTGLRAAALATLLAMAALAAFGFRRRAS